MSIKLRRLQLNVQADDGLYGCDLVFGDGLVVLRAENSMGKSTCVQSIIYALGLERMLGPSTDVPLPHVMWDHLDTGEKAQVQVLESNVVLEIENASGEQATISRQVKGSGDRKLVKTWRGALLSAPSSVGEQRDFFVHDPGAATRSAGFHSWLANFLGWTLPTLPRYNGSEAPLYLECIFPLFLVEQKRGWSGIQAVMPTFLGIRDMAKRAVEFVLNLDAAKIEEMRQKLALEESLIRSKWEAMTGELSAISGAVNGRPAGLPTAPTAIWPRTEGVRLQVFENNKWVAVEQLVSVLQTQIAELANVPVASVGALAPQLTEQLESKRQQLVEAEQRAAALFDEIDGERAQINSIQTRLATLNEDLQHNQDVAKLKRLGSVAELNVSRNACPTCHQHLSDTLLAQTTTSAAMTIEDNVAFIKNQIVTYETLDESSRRHVQRLQLELESLRSIITSLRAAIRSIRQTLTSAESAPSPETIREKVERESRIRNLQNAQDRFADKLEQLSDVAEAWKVLLGKKAELPKDGVSVGDREKLARFETLFREHLIGFGFQSIDPKTLQISPFTYRPTREGFDIGADVSASDNIRIIWSYLHSLLELSKNFDLHHAGLLLFDEPRQQSAGRHGFKQLLARVAEGKQSGHQVIFATSEPAASLSELTDGMDLQLLTFEGRIVKRR